MSDFKVYTNPDIKKKSRKQEVEEVEVVMLPADRLVDQYFASAFFFHAMEAHGGWYVAEEVPEEEGPVPDMYPLLERNIMELYEGTREYREQEQVSFGSLLYTYSEDEQEFVSLIGEMIFPSLIEFLRQALLILNDDLIYQPEGEQIIAAYFESITEDGDLDEIMQRIMGILDEPENVHHMLFEMDEEEDEIW